MHSKRKDGSCGDTIQIDMQKGMVRLPKVGWVKCALSKRVHGRILSATVSRTSGGRFHVSIQCTDVRMPELPKTGRAVGVDLGLKSVLVTSDGKEYPPNRQLRDLEKKLKREQRRLSRKIKRSKRRAEQQQKVARLHAMIADRRKDTIHKMTTQRVREYDVICAESLQAKNMMKNHALAKSIGDTAWGEIIRQLRYKCIWYGRTFVQIDTFFPSSQLCNVCGRRNEVVKDLGVCTWQCPHCGTLHGRDVNAARNILAEGLRLLQ